jgi:hypothetical protein
LSGRDSRTPGRLTHPYPEERHAAKLIYSMITSLDGYAEAAEGDLGSGPADDQEVHSSWSRSMLSTVG